ncbi:MAG: sodium-dependent dicarboxylate transporter 2/3/5, partial [Cycloclasticus sp.]
TAPNTVVFSSGQIATQQMAREGFILNLIGAGLITGVCWLLLV